LASHLNHKLGLGTVQFGQAYGVSNKRGQVPRDEVGLILDRAQKAGLDWLDTAANYGQAEHVLGGFNLKPFRIASKTISVRQGPDAVIARARESAAMLGGIDLLLVHAAADLENPTLWPALQRLKAEGIVGAIGISTYVADAPVMLAEKFRPDAMQVPFSLLDQRLLKDGSLARLKSLGVAVHARSLFLQGALLMPPEELPQNLKAAAPRLAELRSAFAQAGTTPLAAALFFALLRPEIDVGIVGVTALEELDEILAATDAPLPELDWDACALEDERILTPSLWNPV